MNRYFQLFPITGRINFTALDCLRGLAAVYVVINHARGHLFAGGTYLSKVKPVSEWSFFDKAYLSLLQGTNLGHEFVIFFFILPRFSFAFSIYCTKDLKDFYKEGCCGYTPLSARNCMGAGDPPPYKYNSSLMENLRPRQLHCRTTL
ncbi:MAG TPA: hypothetical protein VK498_09765 [Ferruginibacter sp.]|nr:hypothetical protein [Ferruginibacter sp.]